MNTGWGVGPAGEGHKEVIVGASECNRKWGECGNLRQGRKVDEKTKLE